MYAACAVDKPHARKAAPRATSAHSPLEKSADSGCGVQAAPPGMAALVGKGVSLSPGSNTS
eukprot:scaffold80848_cov30-Tisochrysis_lutea.AAC.11